MHDKTSDNILYNSSSLIKMRIDSSKDITLSANLYRSRAKKRLEKMNMFNGTNLSSSQIAEVFRDNLQSLGENFLIATKFLKRI